MNHPIDIEAWLQHTPAPLPPSGLLARLEQDVRLRPDKRFADDSPLSVLPWKPRPRFLSLCGAGLGTLVVVLAIFLLVSGNERSIADAYTNFSRLNSVHVVRHYRYGPGQSVMRDSSLPRNASPNFNTSIHPANPLVQDQIWFRHSPDGAPEMVTRNDRETIWRRGNRQLTLDHTTGDRTFRLDSQRLLLDQLAAPIRSLLDTSFDEVDPATRFLTDRPAGLEGCWVGEMTYRGISINGWKRPAMIRRVWFDETLQLTRRMEVISTDYTEAREPWIETAFDFSGFNESFADSLFEFRVMEEDVRPLGLSLAELAELSDRALTLDVTGEEGRRFQASIRDSVTQRTVEGTLPQILVVDPVGTAEIQVQLTGAEPGTIGMSGNGIGLQTVAEGLSATVHADGTISIGAL